MTFRKQRLHALAALCVLVALPGLAVADGSDNIAGGSDIPPNRDFAAWTGLSGFRAQSNMSYLTYTGSSIGCSTVATGGRRELFYPFTLPEDNRNQFVRVWGFKDGGTPDLVVSAVRSCMSQTQSQPVRTVLGTTTVIGSPGEFSTFLSFDEEPSPVDCQYWVSLAFGPGSVTCPSSSSLRLTRIRVQSEVFDRIFRSGFHNNVP